MKLSGIDIKIEKTIYYVKKFINEGQDLEEIYKSINYIIHS